MEPAHIARKIFFYKLNIRTFVSEKQEKNWCDLSPWMKKIASNVKKKIEKKKKNVIFLKFAIHFSSIGSISESIKNFFNKPTHFDNRAEKNLIWLHLESIYMSKSTKFLAKKIYFINFGGYLVFDCCSIQVICIFQ